MTPSGTLGIIPARGGSRRIPRKNIRPLGGKPLIAYTIEAAVAATTLDRLIVSTDDEEIAKVAQSYGADVPFIRPARLAADDTPDTPVFTHALNWLVDFEDFRADLIVNLRPTTPFKTAEIIDEVVSAAHRSGANVVRTVSRVEGVHNPYWMYQMDSDNWGKQFVTDIDMASYYQSQLLPPVFRINGVVDAMTPAALQSNKILCDERLFLVEVDDTSAVDIDTELDFALCEVLLATRNKGQN
ncbi:MAG TPA: hypothetical protein DHW54_07075 [Gemmatimonadetes bacterium]|nr:hypothetical protein [Gemmatimonadota bacterium]